MTNVIDISVASAKRSGDDIGPIKRVKAMLFMTIVDRYGLPLAVSTYAANNHEPTLVVLSIDFNLIESKLEILIGDRTYDSDKVDEEMRQYDIEIIASKKRNQVERRTQDSRRLRGYERHRLVERYIVWYR